MVKKMKSYPLNNRFLNTFEKNKILIMSHRGTVCANIVDNTLESYEIALRQGADILEIDVCASIDGDLFVIHDGTERTLFRIDKLVTQMSSKEIKDLRYINKHGIQIDHPVNTIDDMLDLLKDRCIINLDRCWNYWDKVLPCIEKHDMADQILLKSPPEKRYINFLKEQNQPYMYMPMIWEPGELDYTRESGINMVAVEVIGYKEDAEVMKPEFLHGLQEEGLGTLISAMTLGKPIYKPEIIIEQLLDHVTEEDIVNKRKKWFLNSMMLAGGHDDDTSLLKDPNYGWGWLINNGFNMIMTDWTLDLHLYLNKCGYRKL